MYRWAFPVIFLFGCRTVPTETGIADFDRFVSQYSVKVVTEDSGGSGSILDTRDPHWNYILTATHVLVNDEGKVDGKGIYLVTWMGQPIKVYDVQVAYFSINLDLAILRVKKFTDGGYRVARDALPAGKRIIACGIIFDGPMSILPAAMMLGHAGPMVELQGFPYQVFTAGCWWGFSGGCYLDPETLKIVGVIQRKNRERQDRSMGKPADIIRKWLSSLGNQYLEFDDGREHARAPGTHAHPKAR